VIKIFNIGYKYTNVKDNSSTAGFLVHGILIYDTILFIIILIYVYIYRLIIYQWGINIFAIEIRKKNFLFEIIQLNNK